MITTLIEGETTVCRGVFGERAQELDCVVSRYLPMFYRRALRFLGNAPDAEDAVQDALLSAYRHLGQFRGQAQLSTWLMTIVTNAARMQLRRRHSGYFSLEQEQGEDGLTFSERLPDSKPSPEEVCSTVETRNRLVEGVQRLSPKLRRAFQLRDINGLTTKEAAHFLGVPQGTVKARLARARAQLAGIMCGKPVGQRSRTVSVGKPVSAKGAPSKNSVWDCRTDWRDVWERSMRATTPQHLRSGNSKGSEIQDDARMQKRLTAFVNERDSEYSHFPATATSPKGRGAPPLAGTLTHGNRTNSGDLDPGSKSADVSRESCPPSKATFVECWQVRSS